MLFLASLRRRLGRRALVNFDGGISCLKVSHKPPVDGCRFRSKINTGWRSHGCCCAIFPTACFHLQACFGEIASTVFTNYDPVFSAVQIVLKLEEKLDKPLSNGTPSFLSIWNGGSIFCITFYRRDKIEKKLSCLHSMFRVETVVVFELAAEHDT